MAKVHQAGLVRMDGQPILPKSFRKYFKNTLGVVLKLEDHHKVVGEPNQLGRASQARTDLLLEPDIQYRVQIDVAQQREHASNNVAKYPITLEAVISRVRLRAPYGRGFTGNG